jgi:hypothetical protein
MRRKKRSIIASAGMKDRSSLRCKKELGELGWAKLHRDHGSAGYCVSCTYVLKQLQLFKARMIARTKEEIDALREGGKRLARHLRILSGMVAPGIVARDLEEKAREMVQAEGRRIAFYGYSDKKGEKGFPLGSHCGGQ